MWAAKITALPSLNDCRSLEGLKPNQSHPKALTSCSQCHLFQTVTGVNCAVLAKSELGPLVWVPVSLAVLLPACHRQGVTCCAAAVVIPPWRGHSYRSGPARGWCLNSPPLPPPPEKNPKCLLYRALPGRAVPFLPFPCTGTK